MEQKLDSIQLINAEIEHGQVPTYIEVLVEKRDELIKYLHENGALMLEHGMGQEDYLQQKMIKEGFKKIELIKDLKDINRFIIGYR